MKNSKITICAIFLVIAISTFKIIKIESTDIWDYNAGFIPDLGSLNAYVRSIKNEKLINISLIAVMLLVVLIFLYSFFKKQENRNDPLVIIKDLKNKSIINDEEYKEKINEAKIIDTNNKSNKNLEKKS